MLLRISLLNIDCLVYIVFYLTVTVISYTCGMHSNSIHGNSIHGTCTKLKVRDLTLTSMKMWLYRFGDIWRYHTKLDSLTCIVSDY